jgi:hypothetical protein
VLGPTITNLSNAESDFRTAFNLGLFFNVRPDKRFFLHVEMTPKSSFGAKGITPYSLGNDSLDKFFETGSVERIIKTMSLTVLGRYAITPHFFVDAGIQPDILYQPKDIFKSDFNENELRYTKKLDDQFTRLDCQLAAGLFYRFKPEKGSMGVGIRYLQGFTDIDKFTFGTQVNTSWQINIAIPIGAVPKEKNPK